MSRRERTTQWAHDPSSLDHPGLMVRDRVPAPPAAVVSLGSTGTFPALGPLCCRWQWGLHGPLDFKPCHFFRTGVMPPARCPQFYQYMKKCTSLRLVCILQLRKWNSSIGRVFLLSGTQDNSPSYNSHTPTIVEMWLAPLLCLKALWFIFCYFLGGTSHPPLSY